MGYLGVIDDEWAVQTVAALLAGGVGVDAVLTTTEQAKSALRRHPLPEGVRRLTSTPQLEPGDLSAAALLLLGTARPPRWLASRLPDVPQLLATVSFEPVPGFSDPVHWCIRTAGEAVDLRLHEIDSAGTTFTHLAEERVRLAGLDYSTATAAVARVLADLLHAKTWSNGTGSTRASPGPPAPADALAVGRGELRIDWSAPAEKVVYLIRAGAGRVVPAWTYLEGFPVSIERADLSRPAGLNVPAGTIVSRRSTAVTVQTGTGLVAVAEVSDSIGPMPLALLKPGIRLGGDVADGVRTLRRRISDLERVVHWMSTEPEAHSMLAQQSAAANGSAT